MKANTTNGYQFKISNGAVTQVFEVKNGYAKLEEIDRNESWTVSGSNIIKTESEHGRTEITLYSDKDGDGIFTKVSKSSSTDAVLVEGITLRPLESNTGSLFAHELDSSHDVSTLTKSAGVAGGLVNGQLPATESPNDHGLVHHEDSDDLEGLDHHLDSDEQSNSSQEHSDVYDADGKEIEFSSGPEVIEFLRQYSDYHHLDNSQDEPSGMLESHSLEIELIGVSSVEVGGFAT